MPYLYTSDAYSPQEIATRVEEAAVLKTRAPIYKTWMLGMMAGGFIGLGGLFSTFVAADAELGFAAGRLLGGLVFSVGYIIAILAGAEVFTSNNLLAMAWASGKISLAQLLKNWGVVLGANAVGAAGLAGLFLISGLHGLEGGEVGRVAYGVGVAKLELGAWEGFARGVLGNLFVCIAVWISLGARSTSDKVLGVILPLSALGALSLEHVVASLYYLPRTVLLGWFYPEYIGEGMAEMTLGAAWGHLWPVMLGNIFGGSFMVATVYHVVYRRGGGGGEP